MDQERNRQSTSEEDFFASLEEQLDTEVLSVHESVVTIETIALMSCFAKVEKALADRGEPDCPTTQEGRDLHAKRAQYVLQLRRRGR